MKNLVFGLTVILILSFLKCSGENPNDLGKVDNSSGKISLKIDRENAPSNVMIITAYLSREGYSTLSGTLNLLSDTSADITFQAVPVGVWHLKIEAENESNVVIYTGETDITVQDNFTTQISLTLEPTGLGVGNIHIIVNWGSSPHGGWMDYHTNPIVKPSVNSFFEARGFSHAKILFDDNIYKMWFTSVSSDAKGYVLYATSIDGINWERPSSLPVLSPSTGDVWDNKIVSAGAVIKDGEIYKMFYSGFSDITGIYQVGLATSTDGINWVKKQNPILTGTSPWEANIGVTEVIKVNDVYYLYYHGHTATTNYLINIGLATSVDGNQWVKFNGNPILTKTQSWEGNGVLSPSVIYNDSLFVMAYGNVYSSISGFGLATSIDGKNWIKRNDNPFFTKEKTYNHWAYQEVSFPHLRKIGGELRVYYTGFYSDRSAIGIVRKIQ